MVKDAGQETDNQVNQKKKMNMKIKPLKMAALAAGVIIGGIGVAQALEADTNATTVAYWKFGAVESIPLSPSGAGILDLATNTGQGAVSAEFRV